MVSQKLTDRLGLQLNPTNGNVLMTATLLHLRGVGQDASVELRYNSLNDVRPTLDVGQTETALSVSGSNVTYTAADGGCYVFTANGSGGFTEPAGISATLTATGGGAYSLQFWPSGVTNYYTANGSSPYLSRSTDVTGSNSITYSYSGGLLQSFTDTQGRTVTFAYTDPNNATQPSTITDTSLNRSISLVYGGTGGALSKVTDAAGDVTNFGYSGTGQLTSITDGNGNLTKLSYLSGGQLSTLIRGSGSSAASTWTFAYPSSTTTTLQDPDGHTATYTFTRSSGAITNTSLADPLGHTNGTVWNSHGDATSSTDGTGDVTQLAYTNDVLSQITAPSATQGGGSGVTSSLTFPSAVGGGLGNYRATSSTDGQGNVTKYAYNSNGETSSVTTPGGAGGTPTDAYQGDAGVSCGAKAGELCTATNGLGGVTTYGYDSNGNPTTVTPPSGIGATTNGYDAAGRLTSVNTASSTRTLSYTYDGDDRVTSLNGVSYTYDQDGNLTQEGSGSTGTTFTYDAQNRQLTKVSPNGTTSQTWDAASNLLTYTDPGGTTTYTYDAADRPITVAEPGGSCPASPAFPNTTHCTKLTYDSDDRRTKIQYPNGETVSTTYDGAGRVTNIASATSSGTSIDNLGYTYANGSADSGLIQTATTNGTTTTDSYDPLNRLTKSVAGTQTSQWTYDALGDRLTAATTGANTTYATFNSSGSLCGVSTGSAATSCSTASAQILYDAAGQRTNENPQQSSLLEGGSSSLANYAPSGQRSSDCFPSNNCGTNLVVTYKYEGETSNSLSTINGNSAVKDIMVTGLLGMTQNQEQRSPGGGLTTVNIIRDPYGNPLALRTGGASYYYTLDIRGSGVGLNGSNQSSVASTSYDAWGNTTSSSGTEAAFNPIGYDGGLSTFDGTIHFGARWYDPATAQWTQPDPAAQPITNTTQANPYTFAGDDPINQSDPAGTSAIGDFFDNVTSSVFGGFTGAGIGATIGFFIDPLGGEAAGAAIGGLLGSAYGAAGGSLDDYSSDPGDGGDNSDS